jgi:serine-type D-Ala-D-Ala carboxypeptidase/endopeptidase (penicillin-binding protein 4)
MADGHYDRIRDRSGPSRRRTRLAIGLAGLACILLTTPVPANASISRTHLERRLAKQMRHAGGASGALVTDLEARRNPTLFSWSSRRHRILASNTKLFTMAALLDRFGPRGTFKTRIYARSSLPPGRHTLHGSVAVVGAGDPALGRGSFARRFGLPLTPLGELAGDVRRAGIKRVTGKVRVDDSIFDRRRGIPTSGVDASGELGPLSGLSYDSGIVHGHYAGNPELVAARALKHKLRRIGVRVEGGVGRADLPARALRKRPLGSVSSPSVASLIAATLRPSNNFFAEMLLKRVAAGRGGPKGTTRRGARRVRKFAHQVGTGIKLENGSGLSRLDRASPRQVVRLLAAMSRRRGAGAYRRGLPLAGEQGTVAGRMNGTAADGRCRTKTGTLIGVSALSGYCKAGHGLVAFSILMNSVNLDAARNAQDRMAALVARYRR